MPCAGCPLVRCESFVPMKHRGHKGLRARHTLGQPAKYFPGTDIRALEAATVQHPDRAAGESTTVTKYLRDAGAVIGYDDGVETHWSYVECGTGTGARSYHGRPLR